MANLTQGFAGKVDGELIRAQDWNGLIAAIDAQFAAEAAANAAQFQALGARVDQDVAQIANLTQRVTALETLAAALRQRQRRIDLSSTRASYAVGEGAEIVARVTDLTGAALDLSNPAARPWVDFVTVWGSVQAAAGFTSAGGTGGRTVSVQVNDQGEARALLRAEYAPTLPDSQHREVAAVLATTVGTKSVAETILAAPTPASTDLGPVYTKVREAYVRKDTPVMRDYLDSAYLAKPTRFHIPSEPAPALSWPDEAATVLAFVKADDNPGTSDGAMAVGSIRIVFRNWIDPWIVTHFMPLEADLVDDYGKQLGANLGAELEPAVDGFIGIVEGRTRDQGILGAHREIAHAKAALDKLAPADPPPYFAALRETVSNGLVVHRSILLGQAAAPLLDKDLAPARAISTTGARGETAAAGHADLEKNLTAQVEAQHARFSDELLKPDGPIMQAKAIAQKTDAQFDLINTALKGKADLTVVGTLLRARTG